MSRSGSQSNTANIGAASANMRLDGAPAPVGTLCEACGVYVCDGWACTIALSECPMSGDGPPYLAGHWSVSAIEYRDRK
jgi:hypothetical protein